MELKELSKQTKKYIKTSNTNMREYKIGSIHIINVIYKIKYTKKSCVGILECSLHKISFFIHRYFQRIFSDIRNFIIMILRGGKKDN